MGAVQTANPPSFESVWAILQENAQGMKELRESQKELVESQKETERIVKGNAYEIGKLSKRMGEVVEYMVAPNLREKFRELGYDFPQANQNTDVSDRKNNIFLEIDVKLEDGDKAMLVEVKTKPTTEDVQDHIKRLEKMRVYADLHGDKRTFLGAVAGVVMTDNVKEYILKQGFFVIEPSGETFNIISPNGKPKEW
jgi:hypothetical protein